MTQLEYAIVCATNAHALERHVNGAIAMGWTPMGGLATACDGQAILFSQALVKTKEPSGKGEKP